MKRKMKRKKMLLVIYYGKKIKIRLLKKNIIIFIKVNFMIMKIQLKLFIQV